MENLKDIISRNLIFLRKKNNLTQIELADKINYSDNAVSRWERGDVTPSIEILELLADFYQVEVKDLLEENLSIKPHEASVSQTANRILTLLFSISVIWFLILIAYIYLQMFTDLHPWRLFVAGVPLSCLMAWHFNSKWGNRITSLVLLSITFWSVITLVYLYFLTYNIWPVFLLGIPLQSALITGFFLKPQRNKNK